MLKNKLQDVKQSYLDIIIDFYFLSQNLNKLFMQLCYSCWYKNLVFEYITSNKDAFLSYILKNRNINLSFSCHYLVAYFLLLICCTSCTNIKSATRPYCNNNTITAINKKIANGNLTYSDIFDTDYKEFDEKNTQTTDILDTLVKNLKHHAKQNQKKINDNSITVKLIDVDAILEQNIDKITDRIIDVKNLKYGIYGTDETRWFKHDNQLKAPLNYFQQQFLLQASTEMLKKLTNIMVKKLTSGDRVYETHYGSFWVVYGRSNKFQEGFELLTQTIKNIHEKAQQRQLSQTDMNVLKTIVDMKRFKNIKASTIGEQLSKISLVSKSESIIAIAEEIIKNQQSTYQSI